MNFYAFHIGDYYSHTTRLSLLEDLAFRRLIDLYYIHEKCLSLDISDVARDIGMMDNEKEVAYILAKFFTKTDFGYSQSRCDAEIKKYKEKQEAARAAGKASAEQRANKRSAGVDEKATDVEVFEGNVQPPVPVPVPNPIPNPKKEDSTKYPVMNSLPAATPSLPAKTLKTSNNPIHSNFAPTRIAESMMPNPIWLDMASNLRPDINVMAVWEKYRAYYLAQPLDKSYPRDFKKTYLEWVMHEGNHSEWVATKDLNRKAKKPLKCDADGVIQSEGADWLESVEEYAL